MSWGFQPGDPELKVLVHLVNLFNWLWRGAVALAWRQRYFAGGVKVGLGTASNPVGSLGMSGIFEY